MKTPSLRTAFFTYPSLHHEVGRGHPECPERIQAIESELDSSGLDQYIQRRTASQATFEQLALAQAVPWLMQEGVRMAPSSIRVGARRVTMCVFSTLRRTKSFLAGEGVLIELVQAPPEVIAALT